jgi:hypothetical protein
MNYMTPKEKAEFIIDKMTMDNTAEGERRGVKAALFFVNEMIEVCEWYHRNESKKSMLNYWKDVKLEINNYYE